MNFNSKAFKSKKITKTLIEMVVKKGKTNFRTGLEGEIDTLWRNQVCSHPHG